VSAQIRNENRYASIFRGKMMKKEKGYEKVTEVTYVSDEHTVVGFPHFGHGVDSPNLMQLPQNTRLHFGQ
jgi:hypothetical protein